MDSNCSCEPAQAYNNLGNALREAGRPDEAVACYTACIQLQLQHPAAPGTIRPAQVLYPSRTT